MNNGETIKKAQEGDLKSIEEICTETWNPLYRFVYFKVQNREEAEDITQETYVKALSHTVNMVDISSGILAYLKTIALNLIRDKWREVKRRGVKVNIEVINSSETVVEDNTEETIQKLMVENLFKKLNDEQQRVLELRIINGFSVYETAQVMKKTEGSVRMLQYRALQKLADTIEHIE